MKRITQNSTVEIIIPVLNEQDSLEKLVQKIHQAFHKTKFKYRVRFIDDGSTDNSWNIIKKLAKKNRNISAIRLRKTQGKTSALYWGFQHSKSSIVAMMDADLQDDPAEIPKMIRQLQKGYGLVNGWKKDRKDPLIKRLSSFAFNTYISLLFQVRLKDINCGIKVMRGEVALKLEMWGDMHRFIPILAHNMGYDISEIPVRHFPRTFGQSKYGFMRFVSGFVQSILVLIMTRFRQSPMRLLGGLGLFILILSMIALSYLFVIWLLPLGPIGTRPLFIVSIVGLVIATQLILFGAVAELLVSNADRIENESKFIDQVLK